MFRRSLQAPTGMTEFPIGVTFGIQFAFSSLSFRIRARFPMRTRQSQKEDETQWPEWNGRLADWLSYLSRSSVRIDPFDVFHLLNSYFSALFSLFKGIGHSWICSESSKVLSTTQLGWSARVKTRGDRLCFFESSVTLETNQTRNEVRIWIETWSWERSHFDMSRHLRWHDLVRTIMQWLRGKWEKRSRKFNFSGILSACLWATTAL
jgi:hypothetical protein